MIRINTLICCLFCLLVACGAANRSDEAAVTTVASSPSTKKIASKTSSTKPVSDKITLRPDTPDQYLVWSIENKSPYAISVGGQTMSGPQCDGDYEHRSYRNRWVFVPTRRCGMCSGQLVQPNETASLKAEEDVVLPAGEYRYVVSYEYLNDGTPEDEPASSNIVSVEFTIPGLTQPEVANINDVISDVEKQDCPEVTDWVIGGAAHFTTPETLPLLLDARVSQLWTHIRLVEATTRVADNSDLIQRLLDGQKGPSFSIAAALAFAEQGCPISACGWESPECADTLCAEVVDRLADHFRKESTYLDEVALALSSHIEKWPPGLVDLMLNVLGTTDSPTLREVLFFDVVCDQLLVATSDVDEKQKEIIPVLKKALRKETRPEVKKEMRGTIRDLEREGVVGYLKAAQYRRSWPDTLNPSDLDEECRTVLEDAKARLSFSEHHIAPVNFAQSIVKPLANGGLPFGTEQK